MAAPTSAKKEVKLIPYEGVVILHPDSTVEAQKEFFKRNKKIIEDYNGSVVTLDSWGRRILGNAIEKSARGVFFHMTFYANNKAVGELERVMRINDRVLRFLHTRLEDGTDLNQFIEKFKKDLAANAAREKEREAKFAERKAQRRAESSRFESEDRDE